MIGGNENVHSVISIVFDVNADNSDLVIAGEIYLALVYNHFSNGFIYFVEEKSCSVRWIILNESFYSGVKQIAFDPNNSNFIFGVAVQDFMPLLFYIDNTYPQNVNSIKVFNF